MNRIFLGVVALALVLLTLNGAAAYTLHYTNWGGGLSPNTWGYGTTALNIQGNGMTTAYYKDYTRQYLSGSGPSYSYSISASRPVYTTQHYGSTTSGNYRTYDYGSWSLSQMHAKTANGGFYAQRNYGGGLWGTGYYGSSVGFPSNAWQGSSYLSAPYSGYSYSTTAGRYPTTWGHNTYYRTPSAYISYGTRYY